MTTVTTLSTHVTAPVNVVLMRGLLSAARRTFPYFNGTMPGRLEANQGSLTVKWRRIENLAPATTALGEVGTVAFGMGRTAATPTITDLTVAVTKHGNHMWLSEDVDLINVNSRAAQLMDTLGENAGHSLNILQRDVYDAITTDRIGSGVTSEGALAAAITANDIKYCVNQLNRQSAMKFFPMATGSQNITTSTVRQSYFGVVHPDVEENIRDINGFIGVEQYGGYTQTFMGEFGAVGGVRWACTEIAPINTGGATTTSTTGFRGASTVLKDIYTSFIYGREAVGSVGLGDEHTTQIYKGFDVIPAVVPITKSVGSAGAGDPYNEVGSIAWKSRWAGKVLNGNWIQKLTTLATDLS